MVPEQCSVFRLPQVRPFGSHLSMRLSPAETPQPPSLLAEIAISPSRKRYASSRAYRGPAYFWGTCSKHSAAFAYSRIFSIYQPHVTQRLGRVAEIGYSL